MVKLSSISSLMESLYVKDAQSILNLPIYQLEIKSCIKFREMIILLSISVNENDTFMNAKYYPPVTSSKTLLFDKRWVFFPFRQCKFIGKDIRNGHRNSEKISYFTFIDFPRYILQIYNEINMQINLFDMNKPKL